MGRREAPHCTDPPTVLGRTPNLTCVVQAGLASVATAVGWVAKMSDTGEAYAVPPYR